MKELYVQALRWVARAMPAHWRAPDEPPSQFGGLQVHSDRRNDAAEWLRELEATLGIELSYHAFMYRPHVPRCKCRRNPWNQLAPDPRCAAVWHRLYQLGIEPVFRGAP